jgi:hypothetical protein
MKNNRNADSWTSTNFNSTLSGQELELKAVGTILLPSKVGSFTRSIICENDSLPVYSAVKFHCNGPTFQRWVLPPSLP